MSKTGWCASFVIPPGKVQHSDSGHRGRACKDLTLFYTTQSHWTMKSLWRTWPEYKRYLSRHWESLVFTTCPQWDTGSAIVGAVKHSFCIIPSVLQWNWVFSKLFPYSFIINIRKHLFRYLIKPFLKNFSQKTIVVEVVGNGVIHSLLPHSLQEKKNCKEEKWKNTP